MNDEQFEAAMQAAWKAFLDAPDTPSAKAHWDTLERLRSTRTPEQHARALNLAGLTADGTPIERAA